LDFPQLVKDRKYLWACLSPVLAKIRKSDIFSAFNDLVRSEWVHGFKKFSIVK
jgi:hypothetical protein